MNPLVVFNFALVYFLRQMFGVVDPGSYLARYGPIPKMVVNAGGDEFLELDDSYSWFDEMPGETHLLMVQDADHSMATGLEQVSITALPGRHCNTPVAG